MLWIIQPALVLDAGISSNYGYTLTVWADQDTVNPGGSTTIYASLVDSSNNPVQGAWLNFSAVAGDSTVQTTSSPTDGSGQCAMGLTLGSLTTQVNVFESSGYGVSTSCVVNVNPRPPNYQMSVGADKNPVKNGETTTVRVHVADVNSDGGLSGCWVSFRLISGDATLGGLAACTDSTGWCSIPVTAGSQPSQITVDHNGTFDIPSNTFTLLCPSQGDNYNLSVTADQGTLPAYGSTTIHASYLDATLGLPMSGRQLVFTVLSGDGTLSQLWAINATDDSGNYIIGFQSGTQPTTIQVTPWDGGAPLSNQSQTLTIGILVHTYQLSLSSTQSMLQPGQQAALTAQLIDTLTGQPVNGAGLNFQVTGGGDGFFPYSAGTYTSLLLTTDTSGTVSIPFTSGYLNSTISVTDTTFSGATQSLVIGTVSTTITITNNSDAGSLALSADANVLAPGGPTTMHAALWDATTGMAVSGGAITYQVTPGDGVFSSGAQTFTAYTDGYGNCDVTFYGGSSPSIVTATASNYAGATAACTFSVQAVVSDTYTLSLTPSQSSLAPNATATVIAQLIDSTTGQPMSGATLNFQIGTGDGMLFDGTSSVTSAALTTDRNGTASITFVGGSLNTTLSVTDSTYSGATQSTVIAELIIKDAGSLTLWADDNVVLPGAAAVLHTALSDTTTGMAVSGGSITYTVTSGDGSFSSGAQTLIASTDGNGNCDVTLYGGSLPSIVTATASDYTGATTAYTFGVQVVVPDTYSLTLSASQTALAQGDTATVSAQLLDATTGSPVPGISILFTVTGGDASLGGSATTSATTDPNGNCSVTLTGGASTSTLSVSDQGGFNTSASCTFGVANGPQGLNGNMGYTQTGNMGYSMAVNYLTVSTIAVAYGLKHALRFSGPVRIVAPAPAKSATVSSAPNPSND